MEKLVYIYAPNISKENLISLLYLQLGNLGDQIQLEILKKQKKGFRTPEMIAKLKDATDDVVAVFVARLFEIAKGLGGTRFVFKNAQDEELNLSPMNITACKIVNLSNEMGDTEFEKIEIY